MATPTSADFVGAGSYVSKGVYRHAWSAGATVTGVGNAVDVYTMDDVSIEISGPTGGTSSITIEGSNGATPTGTYFTLNTPTGVATFTTAVNKMIVERPRYIRPNMTVNTGIVGEIILIGSGGGRMR